MTRSITVSRNPRYMNAKEEFRITKATNITDPHVGDHLSQGDVQNLIANRINVHIVPKK